LYTERKRILTVIIISILMNLSLFLVAYYFKLPLWLDTTGTIYASIILGAPAGFVVAIVNNLLQAFFFYGSESLSFYIVSALTAFVTGFVMKNRKNKKARWIILMLSLLFVCTCVAVGITFIANKGVPADYWGSMIYWALVGKGFAPWICTMISVSSIKFGDIIVSVLGVMLFYLITPRVIKSNIVTVKE